MSHRLLGPNRRAQKYGDSSQLKRGGTVVCDLFPPSNFTFLAACAYPHSTHTREDAGWEVDLVFRTSREMEPAVGGAPPSHVTRYHNSRRWSVDVCVGLFYGYR